MTDSSGAQPRLVWMEPDRDLRSAAAKMLADGVSSVLVGMPGELVSILTERDVTRAVAEGVPTDTPIGQLAVADPLTVDLSETVEQAGRRMIEGGVRHLVVTRGHQAIGVLSARDVMRALLQPADTSMRLSLYAETYQLHREHRWT